MTLAPNHTEQLRKSAISDAIIAERGYSSITTFPELAQQDGQLAEYQRRLPALGIPVYRLGKKHTLILRPDAPRTVKNTDGKPRIIKYEYPEGVSLCFDVLPRYRAALTEAPATPIWFTEGAKKADALTSLGEDILPISLNGVWAWRSPDANGKSKPIPDFAKVTWVDRDVYLCFDSDYTTNKNVRHALNKLAETLTNRKAHVFIVTLPAAADGSKQGADDVLANGWTYTDLLNAAAPYGQAIANLEPTTDTPLPEPTTAEPFAPGQGPVSTRIRTALTQAGYTFRLNELDNWVEVNGTRLDTEIGSEITMAARDADVRPIEAVEPFIIAEAARNRYHPIRDYLNSLVWDGGEHIDALCSYLASSDPQVAYPGDDPLPLHQVYIYRWLIGAVAKVFEQAQNMALVLAGPQNIGKSTLARWLCSGLGDTYFLEMPIDPHDKDNDLRQMRTFIWEIAELDATTRKADMSALKAFITRQAATVRKSYGRYDTTRPTIASFIGTVNKGEGFLSDPTGNRRFLVTTITAINHAYKTNVDVNQVWAQAVALYRSGQPWRLQANEQQAQANANTEHEFDTPLEGWLTSHFDTAAGADYTLTSGEIIDHLRRNYDIRLSGSERAQAMEISRVCQRLGIERRRPNPQRPFVYLGMRAKMPNEP